MQFGFMPGRGTIDGIFVAQHLQERYLGNEKKLYFACVNLEKAFDRVSREDVGWPLRKLGVMEWVVKTVIAMYSGSKSRVRINNVLCKKFKKIKIKNEIKKKQIGEKEKFWKLFSFSTLNFFLGFGRFFLVDSRILIFVTTRWWSDPISATRLTLTSCSELL